MGMGMEIISQWSGPGKVHLVLLAGQSLAPANSNDTSPLHFKLRSELRLEVWTDLTIHVVSGTPSPADLIQIESWAEPKEPDV